MVAVQDVCVVGALGPPANAVVQVPVAPAASELAMWYPVAPLEPSPTLMATVYVAPGAGVVVLGTAVTLPVTAPVWQEVHAILLSGVAWTGLAATTATARAIATAATLKAAAKWNDVRLLTSSPDVEDKVAGASCASSAIED